MISLENRSPDRCFRSISRLITVNTQERTETGDVEDLEVRQRQTFGRSEYLNGPKRFKICINKKKNDIYTITKFKRCQEWKILTVKFRMRFSGRVILYVQTVWTFFVHFSRSDISLFFSAGWKDIFVERESRRLCFDSAPKDRTDLSFRVWKEIFCKIFFSF